MILKYTHLWNPPEEPSGNPTWLAGKSPMNGGFDRNITYFYGPFSIAMLDYLRVSRTTHVEYDPNEHGLFLFSSSSKNAESIQVRTINLGFTNLN